MEEFLITQEIKDLNPLDRFIQSQPVDKVVHKINLEANGKKFWYFKEELEMMDKIIKIERTDY